MWSSFVLWLSLASLGAAVLCPNGQVCNGGTSCCRLPGGGSGCCPLLQAVQDSLPMVLTVSGNDVSGNLCPNKASCPPSYTCLQTPAGSYSCCPLPEGVSCDDGRHCCPRGFHCSGDGRFCLQRSGSSGVNAVICPDGESECPNESTCCEMPDRSWGCCPLPQATCCDDKMHCCPHNTQCDLAHAKCSSAEGDKPMWTKFTARKRALWEDVSEDVPRRVPCPDASTCPNGTTCCQMSDLKYGCCPIVSAICCTDHVHCCPPGTHCDLSHGKCTSEAGATPLLIKSPSLEPRFTNAWALKKKVQEVKCDDTFSCDDQQTCCHLQSGEWGCCPLEEAVCCSDHIHCCPKGTTCDTAHETCNANGLSVPWVRKTRVKEPSQSQGVQCDAATQCNNQDTCCKTVSGGWACCPLQQALCCADHMHCCPSGYTCNVEQRTCLKGLQSIPWRTKSPARMMEQEKVSSQAVKCDNIVTCGDNDTCCRDPGGDWACCPMPQAVCCKDHLHCCPNGYTCDPEKPACIPGKQSISWLTRTSQRMTEVTSYTTRVPCDDTFSCDGGNTCCKAASGEWACCLLPQAVCCADNVHCCPNGYTCNVQQGSCLQGNKSLLWFAKSTALMQELSRTRDVPCDDTSSCSDGNTCCRQASGEWGCCPLPEAVCCSDHIHCCPNGYTCDVQKGSCLQAEKSVPWFAKTTARVQASRSRDVPCGDTSSCEDGTTCCRQASGEWGCCPLPKAVCCSDHVHCCPNGYTCDVEQGSCLQGVTSVPWFVKTTARVQVSRSRDVPCGDTSSCEDGNTCCRQASGEWGCCPLPKAVCCSDHVHCCPNGYTCDVELGSCLQGETSVPWFAKTTARVQAVSRSRDVPCGDTSSCEDGHTCCRPASGEWGCCPLPKAVCCSDHVHCCPSGYTCDVEQGSCLQGEKSVPWFAKTTARVQVSSHSRDVPCDDTSSCEDGSTCCRQASGEWGCCPLPKAVCCSDHVHCCPSGYTCDVQQGSCLQGDKSVPWLAKTRARMQEVSRSRDVPCDDTSSCPDGSTCCRQASGEWECCPLPEAVCCADHVHCCPNGYTCDVEQGSCSKGDQSVPWFAKTTARVQAVSRSRDVPCDDTSSCDDGNTCCRQASGEWGCCPMVKAVCCEDHMHCCPTGYTCNVAQGACTQRDWSIPWLTKRRAHVKEGGLRSRAVPCDKSFACADGTTCCKTAAGKWACCPLPQAVCCSDHVHCCPHGYSCNVAEGTCIQGNLSVTWHTKNDAHVEEGPQMEEVQCDDTTSCPGESTCCKSASSEWACCPFLQAVCCPDGQHCCPSGYRCVGDLCVKGRSLRWDGSFSGNVKMKIL